jgi:hypothetical protein
MRKPMRIYNTSWRFVVCSPSRESLKKLSDSAPFCSHFLRKQSIEKAKQWFYYNHEAVNTWEKCSNSFLVKFFPMG